MECWHFPIPIRQSLCWARANSFHGTVGQTDTYQAPPVVEQALRSGRHAHYHAVQVGGVVAQRQAERRRTALPGAGDVDERLIAP